MVRKAYTWYQYEGYNKLREVLEDACKAVGGEIKENEKKFVCVMDFKENKRVAILEAEPIFGVVKLSLYSGVNTGEEESTSNTEVYLRSDARCYIVYDEDEKYAHVKCSGSDESSKINFEIYPHADGMEYISHIYIDNDAYEVVHRSGLIEYTSGK